MNVKDPKRTEIDSRGKYGAEFFELNQVGFCHVYHGKHRVSPLFLELHLRVCETEFLEVLVPRSTSLGPVSFR
jgi:hypothetical protein